MSRELKNAKYVSITSGTCRVTVLAEDVATNKVNVFSTLISTPDGGITLPLDTTLGRTRELNDIFNSVGNFAGTTVGNEVLNEKTVNLSFADDFVHLSDTPSGMEVSRSTLLNMILGESFPADIGGGEGIQSIVGTNGTVKRTKRAISGHDFGLLFNEIGKLKTPQAKDVNGKSVLEPNVRVTGYNTSGLCVMFEAVTEFDANTKQGLCFAYMLAGNAEWSEDTEFNKLSAEGQLLCDVRYTNGYFIDGFGFDEIPLDTLDGFNFKIVSDFVDATPGDDEIAIAADGSITFGSGLTAGDFVPGTVIWSTANSMTGAPTGTSHYAVVKETGKLGSTKINPNGKTTVRPTDDGLAYVFSCYDFDFEQSKFVLV